MNQWLATTTTLLLLTGVAAAQPAATVTTTESTTVIPVPIVPPAAPPTAIVTHERTVDADGNTTERSRTVTTGAAVAPYGDATTTRRITETTTSR